MGSRVIVWESHFRGLAGSGVTPVGGRPVGHSVAMATTGVELDGRRWSSSKKNGPRSFLHIHIACTSKVCQTRCRLDGRFLVFSSRGGCKAKKYPDDANRVAD